MSKVDYEAKFNVVMAISDKQTKGPNMPVGMGVQEAEDLVAWCKDDKARLTRAGRWTGNWSKT